MSLSRSTAWPMAWVAAALVAYATLYPWTGWQWPVGVEWMLPRHQWESTSDLVSNLLGYMPLGGLFCLAWLRSGRSAWAAGLLALLCCSSLSYLLELVQYCLPGRVPSVADWALNTVGAAWGMLAALVAQALGLVRLWQHWREQWFIPHASWGFTLLWLWPLGLLFPPPLPLAQGQLWPTLQWLLVDWMANTPLQAWFLPEGDALDAMIRDRWATWVSLGKAADLHPWAQPLRECMVVMLGLAAPMGVVCTLTQRFVLRVVLMVLVVVLGVLASTVSAAMNYGPEHALVWLTMPAAMGLLLGALTGAALIRLPPWVASLAGVAAISGLIWLVHRLPADPFYAETLQAWQRGRFIRFHGLSRWFGLLWPYAAMAWLLARLWSKMAAPKMAP